MLVVRLLEPDDEIALLRFLALHPHTTMFLQSNVRNAGMIDTGEPFEGTYAAAFDGQQVVAAAAHYWNGNLLLEAPVAVNEVVTAAVAATGRQVRGILGPYGQAAAARAALGLDQRPLSMPPREILFSLDLSALRVPAALQAGQVVCRSVRTDDVERLAEWHASYAVESLGVADTPELRADKRRTAISSVDSDRYWVLERAGKLVAMSAFNAQLPDCVQIGGVYTPPPLRGHGYARAVVAGSLVRAKQRGVERSILFTQEENIAAQKAYTALGYEAIGDYGLFLFR